jgi:hypothetical protein
MVTETWSEKWSLHSLSELHYSCVGPSDVLRGESIVALE